MPRGIHRQPGEGRVDRDSVYSSRSEPTLNPTRDYRVLTAEQQEQKRLEAQGQHDAERRIYVAPRRKYYED